MPDTISKCIASQRAVQGYKHHLISLDNYPRGIPYLDAPVAAKKWVKAADYLRVWDLIENGGIFCDADMEIIPGKNFDDMLGNSLFAVREANGFIATSILGAVPNHPVLNSQLNDVVQRFKGDDDKMFESSMEIF